MEATYAPLGAAVRQSSSGRRQRRMSHKTSYVNNDKYLGCYERHLLVKLVGKPTAKALGDSATSRV